MPYVQTPNHRIGAIMTKEAAILSFRQLVARYGLQWKADVPQSAHIQMAEICKVLTTPEDRREALGLPR
jgi:hypothetical protein